MRILFGSIEVRAVCHRSCSERGGAGRSRLGVGMGHLLSGTVESIAKITETRNDVFLRVESSVDDGSINRDIRIVPAHKRDALRRGHNAGKADQASSGLAQQPDRGDDAS